MSRKKEIAFTGVKDADREILSRLPAWDLRSACSTNTYTEELCNPLFWRKRFAQEFVDLGFSADQFDYRGTLWRLIDKDRKADGDDLLNYSIEHDLIELFKWAVKNYPRDYESMKRRKDVVGTAIYHGSLKVLRYMIEVLKEPLDDVPLGGLAHSHNKEVIDYIASQGVDLTKDNNRAIRSAINADDLEMMNYIRTAIETQGKKVSNSNLLIWAAWAGANQIVKYLLSESPYSTRELDNAFDGAFQQAKLDTMPILLDAGAQLKGSRKEGEYLIEAATISPRVHGTKILAFLVKNGVDLAKYGADALIAAAQRGEVTAMEYLIEQGVRITPQQRDETIATLNPRKMTIAGFPIAKLLLERAAEPVKPQSPAKEKRERSPSPQRVSQPIAKPQSPRGRSTSPENAPVIDFASTRPRSSSPVKNRSPSPQRVNTAPTKHPASSSVSEPQKVQCKAQTKAGSRCKKWAMIGSEYCSLHQ